MSQDNNSLELKIDRLADGVSDIKVTLARHEVFHDTNTKSLIEHMERTRQNEQLIAMSKAEIDGLKKHRDQVTGAIKILAVVGAIITALHSMGILAKLL